ncbi:winged helix DNA-binding domain-containing protein [Sulfitobacter sp. F26169L]|uniref:winged helix-turn-helix domain-containing protein n=1 Tax=Sulfitobacter sp. F26169L TaxID=2996015 RepID=UPI002260BC3D|nr:crosslink repair DNA glycosylase YcaQ family protein [Sulfitobacter sp. F26169L]MCX7567470.1 winged helix DNA-binding domain-containing protein [Sulfitobacter sp. F26169L]
MSLPRLHNTAARRIFLDRHALLETPRGPADSASLLSLFERLGFVQLDSINTVARAHDLILFARKPRYRTDDLKRLYERDKGLFEHWTHDAAMIPLSYYPQWQLRRTRDTAKLRKQWRSWRRDGFEEQLQTVLDHIRENGACGSSDVGQDEKRGSGGWWDWHPSKTALEYLWRSGALHVVGRENFQKRYDLSERALNPQYHAPDNTPSEAETIDWCCNGALDRLGFATSGEIAAFWAHVTAAEARAWCVRALQTGAIEEIEIIGADGTVKRTFARPDIIADTATKQAAPQRVRVLSPFDPALRDRKRAKFLFGFDYRIEVFVPQAKRIFGYYVFPLLQGDRLIGRVDMKAFRAEDTLRIRALWPEQGIAWGKGRHSAFEAELDRIKRLAGVSKIEFDNDWLKRSAQHQF